MLSLFSTDPGTAGFRLGYMEVLNWGTFNNKVYRINPQGNNSLLTGANGAGKTSYVHALLTLLVPERRLRSYGHFSDQSHKKNVRTEESYVVGEFGEIQEEGRQHTTVQQIRPDKKQTFSILLACFKNRDNISVTIFQTRWFVQGELKRAYGISFKEVTIEQDFLPFDAQGDWKKILNRKYNVGVKKSIEFFDGPSKYAERLIRVLGMRSENALGLFNQIVGIKVLGDLDEFIKDNMLEYQDVEQDFVTLKNNFQTLLDSKVNIEKATIQIELLKPITEKGAEMRQLTSEHKGLEDFRDTSNFWFAERKIAVLDNEIQNEQLNLQLLELELNKKQRELQDLQSKERELLLSIEASDLGKQLKNIGDKINTLTEEKGKRGSKLKEYNAIAEQLKFNISPNKDQFYESLRHIDDRILALKEEERSLDDKIYLSKKLLEETHSSINALTDDLTFLRQRNNNIIGREAQIREDILKSVGATREEIPFIGELIQVKESEKAWESAIERLLHGFALRLVVPEKYYELVNDFVHNNQLNGKIVYIKYKKQSTLTVFTSLQKESLYHKLEFNTASKYYELIENEIVSRYNYVCTDDLGEFRELKKALLQSGLNRSGDRHEKDDRSFALERKNYVLGWNNQKKIKLLQDELRVIDKRKEDESAALSKLQKSKEANSGTYKLLINVQQFENYDLIDWATTALEIKALQEEKERLEKSNNVLKDLQTQLGEVQKRILLVNKEILGSKEENIEGLNPKVSRKEDLIASLERDSEAAQAVIKLKNDQPEDFVSKYAAFEEHFKDDLTVLIYQNFQQITSKIYSKIDGTLKELQKQLERTDRHLEKMMGDFKNPSDEIRDKFRDWKADLNELSDKTSNVFQYEDLYERLLRDDLPSYKRQFDDYLSNTMKDKVAIFRENLSNWESTIEENIGALNDALKRISFNTYPKQTYIQLKYKKNQDGRIKDLINLMEAAIPDVTRWAMDNELDYRRIHFEKIATFIHTLDADLNWRIFTTDVRNWKIFFAEEYSQETNKPIKTYMDMGKLSGGEKAQLTYTILGSAIAYQFGITSQGLEPNSFRFIAVDESFSNQDDQKANYLLNLCEQLHLQLLAVTPSDKIHIVEPKISYVHFVQRRENGESVLFDLPILQFQSERAKWLAKETTA